MPVTFYGSVKSHSSNFGGGRMRSALLVLTSVATFVLSGSMIAQQAGTGRRRAKAAAAGHRGLGTGSGDGRARRDRQRAAG